MSTKEDLYRLRLKVEHLENLTRRQAVDLRATRLVLSYLIARYSLEKQSPQRELSEIGAELALMLDQAQREFGAKPKERGFWKFDLPAALADSVKAILRRAEAMNPDRPDRPLSPPQSADDQG